MKRISLLMAAILATMTTNGCDRSPTQEPAPAPQPGEGRLSLEVRTGAIGMLARAATMTPRKILFTISSGTELVRQDSMTLLPGGQIARDFRLPAGRAYHLAVAGTDTKDVVLYSGQADFPIGADSTTNLSMALDALHSSLQLSLPVKAGAKRIQASLDGVSWLDSTLGAFVRENDTLKVQRDYVAASRTGTGHVLSMKISGNRGDKDTVLFALDTNLEVVSGQSQALRLTLKWVGPVPPRYGEASLVATLGAVGILEVELSYGLPQEFGCREWKDGSGIAWNGTISYGILCDERDSQAYRTVRIGSQVWMAQDLNYAGPDGTLGYCDLQNDPNCQFSGRWYNWFQAMAVSADYQNKFWPGEYNRHQGSCPAGWHIPQISEWRTLKAWIATRAIGAPDVSLRAVEGWANDLAAGTDQFGFHALPRLKDQSDNYWWSLDRSRDESDPAGGSLLLVNTVGVTVKTNGNKVRCIQD